MSHSSSNQRLLTFASGGWLLLLTGLMCLGIVAWAVAPAVMRTINRPPGDGKNIDSYGFDLSNLQVPRELIAPATLYRDMVPVMSNPAVTGPDDSLDAASRWDNMQRTNDPKYGKYLVSNDHVIGVEVNGEARAYPIHVMYVHEIINDTLGNPPVPIAVTYNWLCDSIGVFDRRINGETHEFRTSGLVYNSNMLMYEVNGQPSAIGGQPTAPVSDEAQSPAPSLWSQLLARAVSGPAAGSELRIVPAQLSRWTDWAAQHPDTTVLNRDLSMAQRYKKSAPTQYFNSDELLFPVHPLPPADGPAAKTPVIAVEIGDARRVYSMRYLMNQARQTSHATTSDAPPSWSDSIGDSSVTFICDRALQTVRVETDATAAELVRATHAFWFAWHAMHPNDQLVDGEAHGTTHDSP